MRMLIKHARWGSKSVRENTADSGGPIRFLPQLIIFILNNNIAVGALGQPSWFTNHPEFKVYALSLFT